MSEPVDLDALERWAQSGTLAFGDDPIRRSLLALCAAWRAQNERNANLKFDLDMVAAQLGIANRDEINQRITEHNQRREQAEAQVRTQQAEIARLTERESRLAKRLDELHQIAEDVKPCECGCGKLVAGGLIEFAHPDDYREERS